jgi:hypothetical protein
MKTLFHTALALTLLCLALTATTALADEWDKFNGKWTTKKSNDDGRSWTQVIEINKGKFKFRILSSTGDVRLYAEGDVKIEKHGPFNALKFHNIKGGESADSLESVDDDRIVIYQLGYDTLTIAENFDRERENAPSVDKYTKSK